MVAADNAGGGRLFYERLLPRFLFDDGQPWWAYVLKGWLLIHAMQNSVPFTLIAWR